MTKEHLKRRKNFILLAEDLDLLPSKESMALWEDPNVILRNELGRELLRLIKNVGLRDACQRENTPFSHDGRIALIDTQSWHERHFTCHPSPSWPETYQGIGSQPIMIIILIDGKRFMDGMGEFEGQQDGVWASKHPNLVAGYHKWSHTQTS